METAGTTESVGYPRSSKHCVWPNVFRHAYAWVYVDLEISLLHDLPPGLSTNDLAIPLPHDTSLWNAESYNTWAERYGANGIQFDKEPQSLNSLFRTFLQGRLFSTENLSFHHLRLLLHPLQAMALEQQQLLRIFDSDEPSNRPGVLSKIKVLGRLQETQDMLQQLSTLLDRALDSATEQDNNGSIYTMASLSMVMLHLVSLNTFISIPEIERCAKAKPPTTEAERAELWRWARNSDGGKHILFHAGQVFRLINGLRMDARPAWWPIAIYRAGLACWALRSPTRSSSIDTSPVYGIDMLLPNEKQTLLDSPAGTAVVILPDGKHLPVLEGDNSLQYCIKMLEKYNARVVHSVVAKLKLLSNQWSPGPR
jgi:hypothetical protein